MTCNGNKIIAAAVEFARSRGASIVEAYPVDPSSPSYRFIGLRSNVWDSWFSTSGSYWKPSACLAV